MTAPWARRALVNDLPAKSFDRFAPASDAGWRTLGPAGESDPLGDAWIARLKREHADRVATQDAMLRHRANGHPFDIPGCDGCDQIAGRSPVDHRQWDSRD